MWVKSKRSSYLEKKNLPAILEYMFFSSPNTQRFFKKINSNLIPIPTTIKGTLLPWLENYLIFDENAYWSGEFILSLTFLDPKDMQKYPALFPSIYSYFSESIPSLECLLKDKKWLKELFPDIEDRLQLFDEFCIKASQEPPRNYETYEPMRGFCGNTLNLYHNS